MSACLREALYIIPCSNILASQGRMNPARPGLTHIIPCSNILASLRSLRNCAWNDMGESRTGVFLLENNKAFFLASRSDKEAFH